MTAAAPPDKDITGRAQAGGAAGDLAGVVLDGLVEVVEGLIGGVLGHSDDAGHEVGGEVVPVGGGPIRKPHDAVAVGGGVGDQSVAVMGGQAAVVHAHRASGAGGVDHADADAQGGFHASDQQTANQVRRASGVPGYNEGQVLGREFLLIRVGLAACQHGQH